MEFLDREQLGVVADLESPEEEIRRLAVERLLTLPAVEAVPLLICGLGDSSWRVRKAAVERLAFCAESELVVAALIRALSDGENPGRRNAAVEALVGTGAAAIPALLLTLESPDVDVRKLVVDTLAGIGSDCAREALFPVLSDEDANVRAAAADALGAIGGAEVPGKLMEIALHRRENRLVRLSALRGLVRMEASVAASDLQGVLSDTVLRPTAFTLLGYNEEAGALEILVKGLLDRSRATREAAMAALLHKLSLADDAEAMRVSDRIRETLRGSEEVLEKSFERLRESDLPARLMLIQFLGLVALPSCTLPILEAGRDEALAEVASATLSSMVDVAELALDQAWDDLDPGLRTAASSVLASGSSEDGIARLRESLESPDCALRTAAAKAIGERCAGQALEDLINRLERLDEEDPDREEEREALIDALAILGSPAPRGADLAIPAIELMTARVRTAKPGMRLSMATLLGELASASSLFDGDLIAQLLRDPIPQVRRAAVRSRARLAPERARESLRLSLADESPLVRAAVAAALGSSNEEGVLADLEGLLNDDDARVRAAAARAIGEHCGRLPGRAAEGIALIGRALEDHCPVAIAAVEALNRIGGGAAGLAACAGLSRPEQELVQAAAECVGAHASSEALTELSPLVSHDSWMVRAEAIRILGERRFARAVPWILRGLETEQHDFVRETTLAALKRLED